MEWIIGFGIVGIFAAIYVLLVYLTELYNEKTAKQKASETEIFHFLIERLSLESDALEAYRAMIRASVQAESETKNRS